MKHLLKNEYFTGYSALYLVTLILMVLIEHFPVSQSIAMLLIIGVFFTLVAYLTSKSSKPIFTDKPFQKRESLVLTLILIFILVILTIGDNQIKSFFSFRFSESQGANEILIKAD